MYQNGGILTQYFNNKVQSEDWVPRVELGETNVIYNLPYPSILLYITDKTTRNTLLLLIQEMKRDIVDQRMNLPPSVQQVTALQRLVAYIDFGLSRVRSYLQYIGIVKYAEPAETLLQLPEINIA